MLMTVEIEKRKDVLECFLKQGIWVKITLLDGLEVEGYLRKASAEELKDYQRYSLTFGGYEKYYYVTYKKSGEPDKWLYFGDDSVLGITWNSVLDITWKGRPFKEIIDGGKTNGIPRLSVS